MIEMYESGKLSAKPNTHCYTAVINSCAYCEKDEVEKREALQIAIDTYKDLVSSGYDQPNQITFSTLITALRNLMPNSPKRTQVIGNVFRKCADNGHVEEFVIRRLQSSLSVAYLRELLGDDAVADDGSVNIDQLPAEWRRNARVITPRRKLKL